MALLNKSLDELIAEKKTSTKGGRGGGKGKGNRTPAKGGRGGGKAQAAQPAGRQAGAGRQANRISGLKPVRSTPYEQQQRGRGGGARPVIERAVVSGAVQQRPPQQNRVFVTGLPFDWEKHDILRVMETSGAVENLTIYWDPTGRPTGNALIQYKSERSAKEAVAELDGARLGNHEITVTIAKESQGTGRVSGGRGGGGGSNVATSGGKGSKGARGAGAQGGGRGGAAARAPRANQKTFGRKGGGGKGTYSRAKIEYARVG